MGMAILQFWIFGSYWVWHSICLKYEFLSFEVVIRENTLFLNLHHIIPNKDGQYCIGIQCDQILWSNNVLMQGAYHFDEFDDENAPEPIKILAMTKK